MKSSETLFVVTARAKRSGSASSVFVA